MADDIAVSEGTLPGGLPYLRLGSGPRLVVLRHPGASHASTMTSKRLADDVASFLS